MEFQAKKTKSKSYKIKGFLLIVFALFLSILIFFEIYSPIFINNFEDLDTDSEVGRVGGEFFENNGDKMYYADYKNPDAKQTILMIHGFGGNVFSWRKNVPELSGKYRVILFDLFGFGLSKKTASSNIGIDRDTEVINAFIQDKKLANVVVVGHSLGGVVAQKLAIQNPSIIKSVILINSMDATQDNSRNFFSSIVSFPLIKNPLVYLSYNSISDLVKKSYYDQSTIEKLTIEGYQKGFRYKGSSDEIIKFIKSPPYKVEDLSKLKQLTLIYSSEDDQIVNKDVEKKLSEKIPSSKLISIPKSGHLLMEEQPNLVNEGIDKWITDSFEKLNMA